MEIHLNDKKPVQQNYNPSPGTLHNELKNQIEDLLNKKWIINSQSSYSLKKNFLGPFMDGIRTFYQQFTFTTFFIDSLLLLPFALVIPGTLWLLERKMKDGS